LNVIHWECSSDGKDLGLSQEAWVYPRRPGFNPYFLHTIFFINYLLNLISICVVAGKNVTEMKVGTFGIEI
jgi:hypothetical protein